MTDSRRSVCDWAMRGATKLHIMVRSELDYGEHCSRASEKPSSWLGYGKSWANAFSA